MEQIKETQVNLAEHVLSDTDTEDESDHRAVTAKTKVVKKSAKKQKEADQVDQDFDVFAEEPRRRSSFANHLLKFYLYYSFYFTYFVNFFIIKQYIYKKTTLC